MEQPRAGPPFSHPVTNRQTLKFHATIPPAMLSMTVNIGRAPRLKPKALSVSLLAAAAIHRNRNEGLSVPD